MLYPQRADCKRWSPTDFGGTAEMANIANIVSVPLLSFYFLRRREVPANYTERAADTSHQYRVCPHVTPVMKEWVNPRGWRVRFPVWLPGLAGGGEAGKTGDPKRGCTGVFELVSCEVEGNSVWLSLLGELIPDFAFHVC
ncbi:MAG: hypothetical protein GX456_19795 [Verrucomicrobia bacterium]|nr:hypothetical protein [Verrucomicrobiota bacterium]